MKRTLICLLLIAAPLTAEILPAPEIGPSVKFLQPSRGAPTLRDLRGKMVVVVFFQTWCPSCNQWSSRVFKTTEELTNDIDTVLITINTDGQSAQQIAAYLTPRLTEKDRWLIASDVTTSYHTQITGKDSLYQYAILGPDGTIRDEGFSGGFVHGKHRPGYKQAEVRKAFSEDDKKLIAVTTFPPTGAEYAAEPKLALAIAQAQDGQYAIAMATAKRAGAALAKAFTADIQTLIAAQVEHYQGIVTAKDATSAMKYDAYLQLKHWLGRKVIQDAELSKAIKLQTDALAATKEIRAEAAADKALSSLLAKAARVKDLHSNDAFGAALAALMAKHPDTYACQTAKSIAQRRARWK